MSRTIISTRGLAVLFCDGGVPRLLAKAWNHASGGLLYSRQRRLILKGMQVNTADKGKCRE